MKWVLWLLITGLVGSWVAACAYAVTHPSFNGVVLLALLVPPSVVPVLIAVAGLWTEWKQRRTFERAADPCRRTDDGCLDCGYNLTGNVSGRCPECGRLVA